MGADDQLKTIPVVVLTTYQAEEYMVKSYRPGADGRLYNQTGEDSLIHYGF